MEGVREGGRSDETNCRCEERPRHLQLHIICTTKKGGGAGRTSGLLHSSVSTFPHRLLLLSPRLLKLLAAARVDLRRGRHVELRLVGGQHERARRRGVLRVRRGAPLRPDLGATPLSLQPSPRHLHGLLVVGDVGDGCESLAVYLV